MCQTLYESMERYATVVNVLLIHNVPKVIKPGKDRDSVVKDGQKKGVLIMTLKP